MGVSKSFIESAELSNGLELYIQAADNLHNGRVTISFDGSITSTQILITKSDLLKLKTAVDKAVEYIDQ